MVVHRKSHTESGEKHASNVRKHASTVPPDDENAAYKANHPLVFLSESGIEVPSATILHTEQLPRPTVPPPTPSSEFHFELKFQQIPRTDRDLSELEIPIVRDKGLKCCIDEISEFFQCADYKFNYLQFWFLDVITDCIWRAQDLFEFPQEQQRIIVAWILFVIDIIRDPKQNYTHQEFFDVFKETILIAATCLEEGSGEILLPLKLIQLPIEEEEEEEKTNSVKKIKSTASASVTSAASLKTKTKSTTTTSTKISSSVEKDSMSYESVLEFEMGTEKHRLVLDHEKCNCSEFGESLSLVSSVERRLDEQTRCDSSKQSNLTGEGEGEEEEELDNWDYTDFYKPDTKIPSRFHPLTESEEFEERIKNKEVSLKDIGSTSKLTFLPIGRSEPASEKSSDKLTDYVIFRKVPWENYDILCESESEYQSDIADENKNETMALSKQTEAESKTESEKTQHERIMKGLKNFKIMEQRVRDFSDSKIGLDEWQMKPLDSENIPSKSEVIKEPENNERATCFIDEGIENMVNKETLKNLDEQEFLSFGVLWAVIDFVYEYFSDSFQYTLIKMALTIQPNLIIQRLNEEWRTPKGLIEDLTLHLKDLKDKYKMIQKKIEKKTKKDKKAKKADKKKGKKDKKSDKSSKKSKKEKGKSKKSDKSSKKGKGKKIHLTEEELLLQQQLEAQEAERHRQEMNKRFMFPLQDAIGDEFFMSKFPKWEKVEFTKGKGSSKDKKDKKGKKNKQK